MPGKPIDQVELRDVKGFWEAHPLLGYELPHEPGTPEFYEAFDEVRDAFDLKFYPHLLNLDGMKGKSILDVGCGNGWLLKQYASHGARTHGIDLTSRGVELSRKRFELSGLQGEFLVGSAEDIPFADNTFDMVTSLGVIHHTPRTGRCAQEIIRVCRPGGTVLISVYYTNIFIRKWFYPVTKTLFRMFGRPELARLSIQEYINSYDGPDNPLGKAYTVAGAKELVRGLENVKHEIHYCPIRLLPGLAKFNFGPGFEKFIDRYLGFLVYVHGVKPRV